LKQSLRAQLTAWTENDAAFQAAALRHPGLQVALPASTGLKNLAQAGLMALGYDRSSGWKRRAREAIYTAQAEFAASATTKVVTNTPQPSSDLLQDILPGIETLAAGILR
ncbi:MAG: beta-N-acetylhexosaminidase, partial [Acetobacter cibinongensis]